jgi:proline iminopeptidase
MKKIMTLLLCVSVCACSQKPKQESSGGGGGEGRVAPTNKTSSVLKLPDTTVVQNGGVKMITIGGKYKVWTKKVGNGNIKLLLLHGGPAMTHEYFECFESFMPQNDVEIYLYDQLGAYYSDQPPINKSTDSLWVTARFVEEVEEVRKALGLTKDNFFLLGHSWGGILAAEYALKYQANLKGLIISNMMMSIPEYETYNGSLRAKLRKSLLDTLERYEKKGDFKNPVYVDLVAKEYYSKHVLRMAEYPEPVNRAFKHLNEHIYVLMQGPNEFKVGGRLLKWDRTADLNKISVPTLTIGGEHDTMDPKAMEAISKSVQRGRYLYCPNGSHMSMWDDQPHYFPGVLQFLNDVDAGKF